MRLATQTETERQLARHLTEDHSVQVWWCRGQDAETLRRYHAEFCAGCSGEEPPRLRQHEEVLP